MEVVEIFNQAIEMCCQVAEMNNQVLAMSD
jgi:hypothetical protein